MSKTLIDRRGQSYTYEGYEVLPGHICLDGVLTLPGELADFTFVKPPRERVGPLEFKLLFNSAERVGIKVLRKDDPVLDDFMEIVEDSRLEFVDLTLQSTRDGIGYALKALAAAEKIPADTVAARFEQILTGWPL